MNLDDHEYGSRAQDAGLGFWNLDGDGDRDGNMNGVFYWGDFHFIGWDDIE